jgi:hypothetical protein
MRRNQSDAVARFARAADLGLGLAMCTVTVEGLPLGQLPAQRELICTALRAARSGSPFERIRRSTGLAGGYVAEHVSCKESLWHDHRHLVVAARDRGAALHAASEIARRFKEEIARRGHPVTIETVDAREAGRPEGLAEYLARQWRPSKIGSPFALLRAALQGDEGSRRAYEELAHALKGVSLYRGWGGLGRPPEGSE